MAELTETPTLDATDIRIILARRKAILLKLQLLTDAASGRVPEQGNPGHTAPTSRPPTGVDLGELDRRQGPPPKTQSLYAHYLWHFTMARDDAARTRALCDCAEADYEEYVCGRRHQPGETTEERSKRLLRDYRGWTPERAAHMEGVSPSAFRMLRRRSGYDPQTGERVHDAPRAVAA